MAELLERRRDDDLNPVETAEMAGLLADAPARAEALAQLRVTLLVEAAVACRPPEVMAELIRGVAAGPRTGRIRRLRRLAERPRRQHRAWLVALAAGLLVAVGLAVWWPQDRGLGTCVDGSRTTMVIAGTGLHASSRPLTVSFHDGTRLELADGAAITLVSGQDVHGHGPAKRIRLEAGTLSAEVARQPAGSPLAIATPHALVTVVGTRFRVEVGSSLTRLAVTEGQVKFAGASGGAAITVAAGDEAECDGGEPRGKPVPAPAPPASVAPPTPPVAPVAPTPAPVPAPVPAPAPLIVWDFDDGVKPPSLDAGLIETAPGDPSGSRCLRGLHYHPQFDTYGVRFMDFDQGLASVGPEAVLSVDAWAGEGAETVNLWLSIKGGPGLGYSLSRPVTATGRWVKLRFPFAELRGPDGGTLPPGRMQSLCLGVEGRTTHVIYFDNLRLDGNLPGAERRTP